MATGSGANTWFGIGAESTPGTPVSRTKFFEAVSLGLRAERQVGYSRVLRGLDPQRAFTRRLRGLGDVEVEMFYEGLELLLKHCCFGSSTTTIESGAYRHQFARTTDSSGTYAAVPNGLTIEQNLDIENYIYSGMKVNQTVLKFSTEEMPSVMPSFVGMDVDLNGSAASTPTFPADARKIVPEHFTITVDAADYSALSRGIEVTIGNSLDGERGRFGSVNPKEAVRSGQRPDCIVRLDLQVYDSTTKALVAKLLSGAAVSIKAKALGGTIGATAATYTYMFEAPNCTIEEGFPVPQDSGDIPLTVSLKTMAAAATAYEFTTGLGGTGYKITLHNAASSI